MAEDVIRLVLDEYNSIYITFEKSLVIYTFKDLPEVLLSNLQSEFEGVNNTVDIEFDDISMKTKWVVRPGIIAGEFEGKSFFSIIPGLIHIGIINTIMNTLAKKY